MSQLFYVVGKFKEQSDWELQGIFSTKEKAFDVCHTKKHFTIPIKIDEELPDETVNNIDGNKLIYPLLCNTGKLCPICKKRLYISEEDDALFCVNGHNYKIEGNNKTTIFLKYINDLEIVIDEKK